MGIIQMNQSEHGTSYLPEVPSTNGTLNDKIDQWRTLVGSSVCLAVLQTRSCQKEDFGWLIKHKVSICKENTPLKSLTQITETMSSNISLVSWFSNNYFCSPDTPRPGLALRRTGLKNSAEMSTHCMKTSEFVSWIKRITNTSTYKQKEVSYDRFFKYPYW